MMLADCGGSWGWVTDLTGGVENVTLVIGAIVPDWLCEVGLNGGEVTLDELVLSELYH